MKEKPFLYFENVLTPKEMKKIEAENALKIHVVRPIEVFRALESIKKPL